jgi:hypothetical protein
MGRGWIDLGAALFSQERSGAVIQESVLCLSLLFSRFLKEVQNGGLLIASGLSDLGFYTEPINILNGVGE